MFYSFKGTFVLGGFGRNLTKEKGKLFATHITDKWLIHYLIQKLLESLRNQQNQLDKQQRIWP